MTDLSYSHPLRLSDLAARKPTRFALAPDAAERARIAAGLGILGIESLAFKGTLTPRGRRDWMLEAELSARIVQACVVTTEPVASDIAEKVERIYLAEMPDVEGEEIEMPEDDRVEPLPDVVDLGAVLTEALSLALPPYPRAPGAEFGAAHYAAPGVTPLTDETLRPFAGLADLLKKRGEGAD
jgi:uncharacterized metal-binding protein YceD (DUF177 family)